MAAQKKGKKPLGRRAALAPLETARPALPDLAARGLTWAGSSCDMERTLSYAQSAHRPEENTTRENEEGEAEGEDEEEGIEESSEHQRLGGQRLGVVHVFPISFGGWRKNLIRVLHQPLLPFSSSRISVDQVGARLRPFLCLFIHI